jgi:RHS repeat-associated protein
VVQGGAVQFVRADHIYRPTFATDAAGAVVWAQSYDPFGRVVSGAGSGARFAGQWFAAENGLHQNWMRDYDAALGRYIQTDPLGLVDGASVYGYAGQNPVMNADPTGECFGPAAALLPLCVAGVMMAIDYWTHEGCYTAEDFAYSLAENINPVSKPLKVVGLAAKAGKAYGGGKNAQKNRNRDNYDEQIADAQSRLKEVEKRRNKTPADKAEKDRIEAEIKRLQDKRRSSENHSMKPKG